jgi:uncharacterized protein DUF3775
LVQRKWRLSGGTINGSVAGRQGERPCHGIVNRLERLRSLVNVVEAVFSDQAIDRKAAHSILTWINARRTAAFHRRRERNGSKGISVLYEIEILEARRIAELAAAAREARDRTLSPVREAKLGEPTPARGEHDPAGTLGFAGLPQAEPAHHALREAIEALLPDIRRKLWVVMRTGRGDYAKADWDRAITAAENVSDESIVGDLAEEVDLHDKLMKGLYEIGAAAHPGSAA